MGKNDLIRRRNERDQAFFDAGMRIGIQQCWDFVQIALRNPDIVGKDVFGRSRIEKLFHAIKDLKDHFHPAFTMGVEADVSQEELDRCLKEIWKEDLTPFQERYNEIRRMKYDRPKKGWVEF